MPLMARSSGVKTAPILASQSMFSADISHTVLTSSGTARPWPQAMRYLYMASGVSFMPTLFCNFVPAA
jgi:hypothetical protein